MRPTVDIEKSSKKIQGRGESLRGKEGRQVTLIKARPTVRHAVMPFIISYPSPPLGAV
jgi:hypothetical protein